jgi:hypothetical protein
MISIFFSSIFGHFQPEIYHMILLILNYLKYHLWVLQIYILLEWKYRERVNYLHLLSHANLPADPLNIELERLARLKQWQQLLFVDVLEQLLVAPRLTDHIDDLLHEDRPFDQFLGGLRAPWEVHIDTWVLVDVNGVTGLAVELVSECEEMWHLGGVGVAVEGN